MIIKQKHSKLDKLSSGVEDFADAVSRALDAHRQRIDAVETHASQTRATLDTFTARSLTQRLRWLFTGR